MQRNFDHKTQSKDQNKVALITKQPTMLRNLVLLLPYTASIN